jgi:hypothetical protein
MVSLKAVLFSIFSVLCLLGSLADDLTIYPDLPLDTEIVMYIDPPSGHSSPAALGVFVRGNDVSTKIYYDEFGGLPTFESKFLTYNTPYIQLDTPFKASRNRSLTVIAVYEDETGVLTRSEPKYLKYFVEGSARPDSYGFLVPGIESSGYFVRYGIEIAATARAQVAGGQEFSDFFTNLGIGTYATQIKALNLLEIDPELQGFEGGFPGLLLIRMSA